ncbi:WGxxGxxG family protein [Mycolicibacterium baixiangningiae]|uniref:WGxxGxxG family protein n=1 Tax=Mycolicibacterium baixiangningiae TaxID=2761578 RepID=UPI0018D1E63D|nr:WGxxGxxG family protein [Mycolicibacterium baixiangningiae]
MREIVAVAAATGALLFGGAGVANATAEYAPVQGPTTTLVAQADEQEDGDNTGLWGLAGLLGLLGLIGLKRRKDTHVATPASGTPGYGAQPRA